MPLYQKGSKLGTGPDQNRWLVTRKLGEGQFAEVYEVRDTFSKDKDNNKVSFPPGGCVPGSLRGSTC